MVGKAGFLTALPKTALAGMIDIVKAVEPDTGYGAIMKVSEAESVMRESRIRRTKTVCTYCGVGCSFDVWTKDRHILKVEPGHGPANGVSTCIKGKFAWDFVNSLASSSANHFGSNRPCLRNGLRHCVERVGQRNGIGLRL